MYSTNRLKIQTHLELESGTSLRVLSKPPVNAKLTNFRLKGKTVQNGEPTPENPVPIQSVPSSFDITSCGENMFNDNLAPYLNRASYTKTDTIFRVISTDSEETSGVVFPVTLPLGYDYTLKLKTKIVDGFGTYNAQSSIFLREGQTSGLVYAARQLDKSSLEEQTIILNLSSDVSRNETIYLWLYIKQSAQSSSNFTVDYYDIQIIKGNYNNSSMPVYKPYIGTTTAIEVKDTNDNPYQLCSLPDGTCDEIKDGKIIKRVQKVTISSATNPLVWTYWEHTSYPDECQVLAINTKDKWSANSLTDYKPLCSHFPSASGRWESDATMIVRRVQDSQIVIFIPKTHLTGQGFTLDDEGARAWINKIIADKGKPIEFLYPYSDLAMPEPIDLHPDEAAKFELMQSYQYETNINTNVEPNTKPIINCFVRKLGNRAYTVVDFADENGNILADENGYYIGGLF